MLKNANINKNSDIILVYLYNVCFSVNISNWIIYPFQVDFINAIPKPTLKLKNAPEKHPVIAIIPNPILASFVLTNKSQIEFPNAKIVIPKYEGFMPVII